MNENTSARNYILLYDKTQVNMFYFDYYTTIPDIINFTGLIVSYTTVSLAL